MELLDSLSRPGEPVPNQFISVGTLIPCFFEFLFNNVLPTELPVRFLAKNSVFIFRLRVCYMSAYLIIYFVNLAMFYVACKLLNSSL